MRPLTDDRSYAGYGRPFTDAFARHIGSVDGAGIALNGNIALNLDGLDINGSDLFLECGLLLLSDNCADEQGSGK